MSTPPPLLCGVTGFPLGQTLSPLLHNWAFARLRLAGAYHAWPQPPEALAAFVAAVRTLRVSGVSVTIPHKERMIPLLDGITPAAQAVGAVNTLFWREGALRGDNTDLEGFSAPLRNRPPCGLALVLGAGGAARAVLAALRQLNVPERILAARDPAKAAPLAREFGCRVLPWAERASVRPRDNGFWVVNTTPLGMAGHQRTETPYPVFPPAPAAGGPEYLAYDLVYNPLQTRFLAEAAAAGWAVQDGLSMFVVQAAAQFRLWTGREFPLDEARAVVLEGLKRQ